LRAEAERLAVAGYKLLVLDAPVMLKAGWDAMCDAIVFVDAPRDVRLQRALGRGWTPDEFTRREQAQESAEIKRKRANYVIDNGGSIESTRAQTADLWRNLAFVVE
jgi:dephospho-CoA kinase